MSEDPRTVWRLLVLCEEYDKEFGERLNLRSLGDLTQEEAVVIIDEMVRSEREKRARGG